MSMRPHGVVTGDGVLLVDSGGAAESDAGVPGSAVVGRWPVGGDGTVGPFRSNPEYRPRDDTSVTDVVDALLRLAGQSPAATGQLQMLLREALFELAMNGDGRPLVTRSPDDVPCVVIVTSASHRRRVNPPGWRRIDLVALVTLLADGVDVLFNPAGAMLFRLTGDFIRETLLMTDEDAAAAYEALRLAAAARVDPWTPATPA
ncbi:type VII secretion system-associated protein [Actinoplanes sp. NPDC049118]|uniref:type VII secretion system-associated protein n=1 Tax=Actinoplanes sp. NPDC049118 TaxID=3155769 RepID=UPI00340A9624